MDARQEMCFRCLASVMIFRACKAVRFWTVLVGPVRSLRCLPLQGLMPWPATRFMPSYAQLRLKHAAAQVLLRPIAKDSDPADWLDQKHAHQRSAFEIFLADRGACPQRYLAEALPCLPFPSSHFDLVLSGHLMFSYAPVEEGGLMVSDGLDLDWHHAALIELCRVSRFEVRIYPAHTSYALIAERHHYAKWLLNHLPLGWNGEFTTPHYFQGMIGCTDGLRLWRGGG